MTDRPAAIVPHRILGRIAAAVLVALILVPACIHASPYPPPPSPIPSPSPWKQSEAPDAAAAIEVTRQFALHMHAFRLLEAFRLVHGIPNPEEEARACTTTLQEDIATESWAELAQCEDNILAIASALESYGREVAPGSRSDGLDVYPRTLQALTARPAFLLSAIPSCPSKGSYAYARTPQGYNLCCSSGAHGDIGVKGRFPAYTPHLGLTLGNQKLSLAPPPHFVHTRLDVRIEGYVPDRDACIVRLDEVSSFDINEPPTPRTSRLVLTRHGGRWLVDLVLSNRDMALIYDFDTWERIETIPKIVLFYYELTKTPFNPRPDIAHRGQLKLRICKANLRNISLALERWSVRHRGGYPPRLSSVFPSGPGPLPACPGGGTYRYRTTPDRSSYTVQCKGHAHADAGLSKDLPAINPSVGITETP